MVSDAAVSPYGYWKFHFLDRKCIKYNLIYCFFIYNKKWGSIYSILSILGTAADNLLTFLRRIRARWENRCFPRNSPSGSKFEKMKNPFSCIFGLHLQRKFQVSTIISNGDTPRWKPRQKRQNLAYLLYTVEFWKNAKLVFLICQKEPTEKISAHCGNQERRYVKVAKFTFSPISPPRGGVSQNPALSSAYAIWATCTENFSTIPMIVSEICWSVSESVSQWGFAFIYKD